MGRVRALRRELWKPYVLLGYLIIPVSKCVLGGSSKAWDEICNPHSILCCNALGGLRVLYLLLIHIILSVRHSIAFLAAKANSYSPLQAFAISYIFTLAPRFIAILLPYLRGQCKPNAALCIVSQCFASKMRFHLQVLGVTLNRQSLSPDHFSCSVSTSLNCLWMLPEFC